MKRLFSDKSFYIFLGVAAVLSLIAFLLMQGQGDIPAKQQLSNSLFAGGALTMGFGGLRFCGANGTFDLLGFGVSKFYNIRWPFLGKPAKGHEGEKYHEYKERKAAEEHPSALPPLCAGAVFVALAAVFLIL